MLFALGACEGPVKPKPPTTPPAPAPAAAAPATPLVPAAPPADAKRHANIKEVLTSGKYSILEMDACGATAWVAGPLTADLKVGQTLELPLGTPMADFEAKELGRTFADILFVEALVVAATPLECPKQHHQTGGGDPKAPDDIVGVVKETMESGGYRYARLDTCGDEVWIAGPKVPLQVGETLMGEVSTEMKDFTSATLGRRFDHILFLTRITIGPKPPDCKGKAKGK